MQFPITRGLWRPAKMALARRAGASEIAGRSAALTTIIGCQPTPISFSDDVRTTLITISHHARRYADYRNRCADRGLGPVDDPVGASVETVGAVLDTSDRWEPPIPGRFGWRGDVFVAFNQSDQFDATTIKLHRQCDPRTQIADRVVEAIPPNHEPPRCRGSPTGEISKVHDRRRRAIGRIDQSLT